MWKELVVVLCLVVANAQGTHICKGTPMFGHLSPMTSSDLRPLRWPAWFNDTMMAWMQSVKSDQWSEWMLNSKFTPYMMMNTMMMNDKMMCTETPDIAIPAMKMVQSTPEELKIRLVGGPSTMAGRLEVYHNNEWGTVCQEGFGEAEAQVVCNALGFKGTAVVKMNAAYGMGNGNIWLSGLDCNAKSMHLASCRFNQLGLPNPRCTHSMDVGVMCLADSWTRTRLVGGSMPNEGRVEVFLNGEWGTVCDNGFGWKEAQVVCNGLGYWGKAEMLRAGTFGAGMGKVWLDGVKCTADMQHLSHCVSNEAGTIMAGCTHDHDVAVRCSNATVFWMCPTGNQTQTNWMDRPYNMFNQAGKTVMMLMHKIEMKKQVMDMFTPCSNLSMSYPSTSMPAPGSSGSTMPPSSATMMIESLWKMLKETVGNLDMAIMASKGMTSMPQETMKYSMSQSSCGMMDLMTCMTTMGVDMMMMYSNYNSMGMMGWTMMQNQTFITCMGKMIMSWQNMPPLCQTATRVPSLQGMGNMMPCINDMSVDSILKLLNMKGIMLGMGGGVMNSGGIPIMMPGNPNPPSQIDSVIWSCNFDTPMGFCGGMMNLQDEHFNWMLGKGTVMTPMTGPNGDHTTGYGHYAYVDVSNRNPGDRARLQLASLTIPSGGACLQFWYSMYGKDVGTLRLKVKCSDRQEDTVWEKSGQQSTNKGEWKWAEYYIRNMGTCQVLFEAQVANMNTKGEGDMAVDDIKITTGNCSPMPLSG